MSVHVSTTDAGLVRNACQRLCRSEQSGREWFEEWQAEFDAVAADGHEEACALLVDILIAYDHWQA
jgi:hypothetical protein